jgi:hypothetical protein
MNKKVVLRISPSPVDQREYPASRIISSSRPFAPDSISLVLSPERHHQRKMPDDGLSMHRARQIETAERISELASILATGLQRVFVGQSSAVSKDFGESSLPCSPLRSGDELALENEEQA